MPIAPARPGDERPPDVSLALNDANVIERRRRYVDGAHVPESDFGSRSVAGNFTMSVADMGRFIRENLRPDPQVMSPSTRAAVQSQMVTLASGFSRGGWSVRTPSSPAASAIGHNGDGGSMYADVVLRRPEAWGRRPSRTATTGSATPPSTISRMACA
jgi:hypothetical protein